MADTATPKVIWLPASVASAKTGRSGRTLARWADAGRLTDVRRTDGGHRRYREDEIEALVGGAA